MMAILPKTLYFAGIFIYYGDEVLLMKRGLHKKYSPGMWAGVGGHIETEEINDPAAACLREAEEETGVKPELIRQLELRYFALLRDSEFLHGIYYFTGELKEKPARLIETDEGELSWVNVKDAVRLPMGRHIGAFFRHWAGNPGDKTLMCYLDEDIRVL